MRREQLKQKAKKLKETLIDQLEDTFNSNLNNLVDDFLHTDGPNGSSNGLIDQVSSRNYMNTRKVFKARHSMLTELLEVSHIRTIYNIFVAILIVFSLNTLAYDYIEHGKLVVDFSIITWAFGNLSVVVVTWLIMQLQALAAYPLFCAWVSTRIPGSKIPDLIWLVIHLIFVSLLIVFPLHEIHVNQLPPVSRVILVMEQVRFFMKIHAFIREVAPRVVAAKSKKVDEKKRSDDEKTDDDEESEQYKRENINIPGFSQFLYFLFAPTLVYRDSYPQTPNVRWKYVVSNFAQVVGCVFYTYYVFVRFCVPVFRDTGKNPPNLKRFVLSVFNAMLPGTLVLVLGFFCILHSWLNAFAEMMTFADRMFYKDWWNATSYADYYRTWNVVVHDWLYAYIYKDFHLLLYGYRNASMIATFLLSALVHEYIVIVTFNFFYPVLFLMFFGLGVSFVFLKPKKGIPVSPGWNIFMWVTLFLGNGLLMVLYCLEWFAIQNNPKTNKLLPQVKCCLERDKNLYPTPLAHSTQDYPHHPRLLTPLDFPLHPRFHTPPEIAHSTQYCPLHPIFPTPPDIAHSTRDFPLHPILPIPPKIAHSTRYCPFHPRLPTPLDIAHSTQDCPLHPRLATPPKIAHSTQDYPLHPRLPTPPKITHSTQDCPLHPRLRTPLEIAHST